MPQSETSRCRLIPNIETRHPLKWLIKSIHDCHPLSTSSCAEIELLAFFERATYGETFDLNFRICPVNHIAERGISGLAVEGAVGEDVQIGSLACEGETRV